MGLILRIPGVSFTDPAIPKLYRDQVANAGTLDIFDALDDFSWSKQGDPAEGVDTWKSLIGPLPQHTASFAGAIGWDDGFTMDNTADIITFPSTFKAGASGKACVIFWTKVGTQVSTTGNGIIGWIGDSNANSQFLCFLDHNTTDASTNIVVNSGNGVAQIATHALSLLPASRVAQIAVSMEPEGGVYRYKVLINGALKASFLSALTSLPQPTNSFRMGGTLSGYTNAYIGTHLRALVDDLSDTTAEELVALDYELYSERFAA